MYTYYNERLCFCHIKGITLNAIIFLFETYKIRFYICILLMLVVNIVIVYKHLVYPFWLTIILWCHIFYWNKASRATHNSTKINDKGTNRINKNIMQRKIGLRLPVGNINQLRCCVPICQHDVPKLMFIHSHSPFNTLYYMHWKK